MATDTFVTFRNEVIYNKYRNKVVDVMSPA